MTDISKFIRGGTAKSISITGSKVDGDLVVNGVRIPESDGKGHDVRVEGNQVWIDGMHRPDLSGPAKEGGQ